MGDHILSKLGALDAPGSRSRSQGHFLSGKFNSTLVKDPTTGYLSPSGVGNMSNQFDARRKKKFIDIAKDLWPNLAAVCEMVGISRGTLKNHLMVDGRFREDLDLIREASVDTVEKNMFVFSNRPSNFMDRMAIMRAYRGDLYNPKTTITYEHKISREESEKRRMNRGNAIDVEVLATASEVLEDEVRSQPALVMMEESKEMVQAPQPVDPLQMMEDM